MDASLFRQRQPRVVFGACPPWQGISDLQEAVLNAAAAGADCFACQAALSADGALFALRERAASDIAAADGSLPRALEACSAASLDGRRDVMEAGRLLGLCARVSLPLALLMPWRVTRAADLRRRCLRALDMVLSRRERRPPLLLASSATALLAAVAGEGLARGLLVCATHSCDMSHLMREARADICVLPRELATDCRLCGLREARVCTLIIGAGGPDEILRLSISGADGFVCAEPAPLLAAFRRNR